MLNPRLASRYAKSLLSLSREQGNLDAVQADMAYIKELCKKSSEFKALLKSPVIKADKKISIVSAVLEKQISTLSYAFVKLLAGKGRENLLPEIAEAFIDLCYEIKGIQKVKLTTATPVSEELRKQIVEKVKAERSFSQVELETIVKDELIGGFQLEFQGKLIDASISRDLRDVQLQFKKNDYIKDIR